MIHPPPLSLALQRRGLKPRQPSFVGVVGSMDAGAMQYHIIHGENPSRQENIEGMYEHVLEMIRKRVEIGGVDMFPKMVVMLRDGVSFACNT